MCISEVVEKKGDGFSYRSLRARRRRMVGPLNATSIIVSKLTSLAYIVKTQETIVPIQDEQIVVYSGVISVQAIFVVNNKPEE